MAPSRRSGRYGVDVMVARITVKETRRAENETAKFGKDGRKGPLAATGGQFPPVTGTGLCLWGREEDLSGLAIGNKTRLSSAAATRAGSATPQPPLLGWHEPRGHGAQGGPALPCAGCTPLRAAGPLSADSGWQWKQVCPTAFGAANERKQGVARASMRWLMKMSDETDSPGSGARERKSGPHGC